MYFNHQFCTYKHLQNIIQHLQYTSKRLHHLYLYTYTILQPQVSKYQNYLTMVHSILLYPMDCEFYKDEPLKNFYHKRQLLLSKHMHDQVQGPLYFLILHLFQEYLEQIHNFQHHCRRKFPRYREFASICSGRQVLL